MFHRSSFVTVCGALVCGVLLHAQAPTGPVFDVVSIKRNTSNAFGSNGSSQRPDGGFTLLHVPIGTLISQAYPGHAPIDIIGLPDWAMREYYDVSARSPMTRPATADERTAMMRGMLADRIKLQAHLENRDLPVYDLVLARDGRLGPRIKPSDVDCASRLAEERTEREAALAAGQPPPAPSFPAPGGPPPPCSLFLAGPRMDGGATMAGLATMLRLATGRPVIDKTGLTGYYQISMEYDRLASVKGPDTVATPGGPPSVFTAVQEQLGMKLESSTTQREVLVIDHLERPSEN